MLKSKKSIKKIVKDKTIKHEQEILGWREWVSFPKLKVSKIKAKIDTGARTSALHAYDIKTFTRNGIAMVRFIVHPLQRDDKKQINCVEKLHDLRTVKNSGGQEEIRFTIVTDLTIGKGSWPIEITLTNRDSMGFRLLLGRTAIRSKFLVNPGKSFIQGKK